MIFFFFLDLSSSNIEGRNSQRLWRLEISREISSLVSLEGEGFKEDEFLLENSFGIRGKSEKSERVGKN